MEVDHTETPGAAGKTAQAGNVNPPPLSESAVLLSAVQLLRVELAAMRAEITSLKGEITTIRGETPKAPVESANPAPHPIDSLKGRTIDDDLIVLLKGLVKTLVMEALEKESQLING
jgi:hypothetical protein